MSECNICYSSFSSSLRKKVKCNSCNYSSCAKCVRTFLFGLVGDAKCMNCNVEWTIPFMYESISKNFVMEFKKHHRNYLFQKQLYLLPILSEYVEYEKEIKKCRKIKKDFEIRLQSCRKKESRMKKNIFNPLHNNETYETLKKDIKFLKESKVEEQNKIQMYKIDKDCIYNNFVMEGQMTFQEKKDRFVRHRPCVEENCKGFLNKDGNCPICDSKVCMKCNVLKMNHKDECNSDDVKTLKEIQKNTRSCPKCSVPIFKISGCDQMWCTSCNTAFSWKTGLIITGPIHNPHYFEWLFQKEQKDDDTIEWNEIDDDIEQNNNILPSVRSIQNLKLTQYDYVEVLSHYRELQHLISEEIPLIQTSPREYRRHMFEIMYQYITKNKNIEKNLDNVETSFSIRNELMNVLDNFKQQQIHLFRGLSISKTISIQEFKEFYQNNIDLYNTLILKLNECYGWYYRFQFQKSSGE